MTAVSTAVLSLQGLVLMKTLLWFVTVVTRQLGNVKEACMDFPSPASSQKQSRVQHK